MRPPSPSKVDRNAVQRSQTMQLTVLPEADRRPPSRLRSHFAVNAIAAHDASMEAEHWQEQHSNANKHQQWVIANGYLRRIYIIRVALNKKA